MKTIEELKGMTQEDLVRLVQELQDSNESLRTDMNGWIDTSLERINKIESLTDVVKKLSALLP